MLCSSLPLSGVSRRCSIQIALAAAFFSAAPAAQAQQPVLSEVTVTGTREATPLSEASASVGVINNSTIKFTAPSHPQQLLGQIPGVSVNVTNGEGHTTGIRQKIGTDPVYLYLGKH